MARYPQQQQQQEEADICPICRDTPRDIFITSCGHAFCGSCICRYLFFRATSGAGRACPACRQQVLKCTSTSSGGTSGTSSGGTSGTSSTASHGQLGSTLASFQLGRVLLQVDIPKGAPSSRLSELLKTPANKLKLIHKGRVLQGDADITLACLSKVPITLLPQAPMQRPPLGRLLLHYLYQWLLIAWALIMRHTGPLRRALRPWLVTCHTYCQPLGHALVSLVMSVNPEWANRNVAAARAPDQAAGNQPGGEPDQATGDQGDRGPTQAGGNRRGHERSA